MKAIHLPSKSSQFWLLGLAAALATIHLTLTMRAGDAPRAGISILFYLAVAFLLWEKRHSFSLKTRVFPSLLGTLLITGVFIKSAFIADDYLLRLLPFLSALGLSLIASSFKGIKLYYKELIILFFLGVPSVLLSSSLTDISPFTAKLAAFFLWYSGFKVSLQGVYITLPTGGVVVSEPCSGMKTITYLLGLAVIFLVMFPINRRNNIIVPIAAVVLGFVVNGFRVAFLTILSTSSNQKAFDYWHYGDGSAIVGIIAVLLLGLFCLFLLRQEESENEGSIES
jgi:cyanoexosortase A